MVRITETKTFCNLCGSEECDGKEYILPAREQYCVKFAEKRVCSSQVRTKNGKILYDSVVGHGMKFTYEVVAVSGLLPDSH